MNRVKGTKRNTAKRREDQERFLKLLSETWLKMPHLRFMQLIGNCHRTPDPYYMEDKDIELKIRTTYKNIIGE